MSNPVCPVCGLYELNDGSEDTLYTCECDDQELYCAKCGEFIPEETVYYVVEGKVTCKPCTPGKEIGERQ